MNTTESLKDYQRVRLLAIRSLFEIIEQSSEGTVIVDRDANIVWMNERYARRFGLESAEVAIGKSCDVYFFRVADRLGIDRMAPFMAAFGYGVLTGIDIPGEKPGLYASPEWKKRAFKRAPDQVWFPGETISMGIGQGPVASATRFPASILTCNSTPGT